jgi:hypothetical protein
MIDPEIDAPDQPDYKEGIDWAVLHAPELVERYSSTEITGRVLRDYLWRAATEIYPTVRGDMENDLRGTYFVLGAIKRIIDSLPFGPEAMKEVFEIGLELGSAYGAEKWKYKCFLELKGRDLSWWRKRKGAASPQDIVLALSSEWWRRYAKEKHASKTSKWEILIDTLGTREMCILAHLTLVELEEHQGGRYKVWTVNGKENNFQMMASSVWEMIDGRQRMIHGAGEIVG